MKERSPDEYMIVDRQPLSVRVYENLKRAILTGKVGAGSRLNETVIARELTVSTTPVREALRRLASEGLVTIVPWRGAIVEDIKDKHLVEVYQCRAALEGFAARLAAESMDESGIEQLHDLLAQAESTDSPQALSEINSQIHNVIIGYANNSRLASLLELFNDVILTHRDMTAYSKERRQSIHQEHIHIVDALMQHDADRAENAMRRHVLEGLKFISRSL